MWDILCLLYLGQELFATVVKLLHTDAAVVSTVSDATDAGETVAHTPASTAVATLTESFKTVVLHWIHTARIIIQQCNQTTNF